MLLNEQAFLGKACVIATRTHWYAPPERLGVCTFFALLIYNQTVYISKRRKCTKWTYQHFTPIMMQYQEVNLGPLLDGQTMPKQGEVPIAHHYTPPIV